jgi:serine protease SohB
MHFMSEYGLFLAKAATVIVGILIVAVGILWVTHKAKQKENGKLIVEKLNEKYDHYQKIIDDTSQNKIGKKEAKKRRKIAEKSAEQQTRKRLFVLQFQGDIKASAVNSLREEITAILLSKNKDDEVLLCIDSSGGLVHGYGLAAAQIQRLKEANVRLTVAIDKVAASGGYLMACLADHLIAAPFAIIGSIGVIAQLPNFHRWLEKKEIDFEQIIAGQYKRTLTLFGKNTPEGREKLQEEINEIHHLFKAFIERYRPSVNIEQVSTGEHWFGMRAVELKLIDSIKTSDDFLLTAKPDFDMYLVKYDIKKPLTQRLSAAASMMIDKFL